MTTKNKLILGSVIALIGGSLYVKNKVAKLTEQFYKLTTTPAGFSNLDVSFKRIKVNVDVKITNPTADDFYVSGYGIARLTQLDFFYKNTYLATATLDKTELNIPANDFVVLEKIPIEVNFDAAINNLNNFLSFNINDLTITSTITTIGGANIKINA